VKKARKKKVVWAILLAALLWITALWWAVLETDWIPTEATQGNPVGFALVASAASGALSFLSAMAFWAGTSHRDTR